MNTQELHLAYKSGASLEAVRAFLGEVVTGGAVAQWTCTHSVRRPHEMGDLDVLAHTTWSLEQATLVQKVDGGDGNPRDGYGFDLSFELRFVGSDGLPRTLSLMDGNWDPVPKALHFNLMGFTASEFVKLRALGAQRFQGDETAHPVWAAHNTTALLKVGELELARSLVDEALSRDDPFWSQTARRQLQRRLVELTVEPTAKRRAESNALKGDPTDVERLARVASGEVVLPGWAASSAADVLLRMRPANDPAGRARSHPWWSPAPTRATLEGWSSLRRQLYRREADANGRMQLVPDGRPPQPVSHTEALEQVQGVLKIAEAVFLAGLKPDVLEAREGRVVSLEPEVHVRGMAFLRVPGEPHHTLWTWLWTGEGAGGAVIVSRVRSPSGVGDPAEDTHVLFTDKAEERSTQLLARSQNLSLVQCG